MKCIYIVSTIDREDYDVFISHLGERCKVCVEDIESIDLSKHSLASSIVWTAVDNEDYVIIDARKINMAISVVLYARYLRKPEKTFLLLSPENEERYSWGYGASFCKLYVEENERIRKLTKLQKDIAYYFGLDEEDDALNNREPVREFLESFWKNNNMEEVPVGFNFCEIETMEENSGEAIIDRLKVFSENDDLEGFKEELRKIADNKDIAFDDYIIISHLCKEMKLKRYRISIMEQGCRCWGINMPQMKFELIEAYASSPSKEDREKALNMAEDYFGIIRNEEGMPELNLENKKIAVEDNYVKTLFNAYIGLGKFDALYHLSNFEEQFTAKVGMKQLHPLFVRNKAICMREQGEYEGALKLFRELYDNDPSENTLNLIAMTNNSAGRNKEAAKLFTMLIQVNYGDDEPVIRLTEIMWRHSLYFDRDGKKWNASSGIAKETRRQIVPLLLFLFSFEANQDDSNVIYEVNKLLNMFKDADAVNYWMKNKDNSAYLWNNFCSGDIGQNYDFSLIDYLRDMHQKIKDEEAGMETYIKSVLDSIYEESRI